MPSVAISFDSNSTMTNEISPCINCPFSSSDCELYCCNIGYCKTCCIVDRQCVKCNKTILKKLIKQKEKENPPKNKNLKRKRDSYEPHVGKGSQNQELIICLDDEEISKPSPPIRGQFYYGQYTKYHFHF